MTSKNRNKSTAFTVLGLLVAINVPETANSFGLIQHNSYAKNVVKVRNVVQRTPTALNAESEDGEVEGGELKNNWTSEQVEQVGNLCADDEWMGLSMELSELVRVAVIEDVKKKSRDFLGKDEYKVGDITKEIDDRVKTAVADIRGKDEYELGDLSQALDELSKDMTCQLTGKDDYEFGDLSTELDGRVKDAVAVFCGKESGEDYEFGDLSTEMSRRVNQRVLSFIDKDEYEFGDITRQIESKRKEWISDFLGEEAAENYQFGDITKKALSSFTGKDEYEVSFNFLPMFPPHFCCYHYTCSFVYSFRHVTLSLVMLQRSLWVIYLVKEKGENSRSKLLLRFDISFDVGSKTFRRTKRLRTKHY